MPLLKYFKRKETPLPNPNGSLVEDVPSTSIAMANREVKPLLENASSSGINKRGSYQNFTGEEKAKIVKRASEMGVTGSIRYFAKNEFVGRPLKESTVRTWMNQYRRQLKLKASGSEATVESLDQKRRGRPFLLGEELDRQVQAYIKRLRENGAVINTAIVMAVAEGIVMGHDSNLLKANGGHIACNKNWAKSVLSRLGYVKRRASTKMKVLPQDFEAYKSQFVFDIQSIIELEEIPGDLVINWDHTGIHYVPVGSWTMAKEGSKRVEIAGVEDKRQLTAVLAGTMSGKFLPPQVIYGGKTPKCLPSVEFPKDWDITYTPNHWANEATTERYIEKILLPYIERTKAELSLHSDQPALVIFDRFKGQCTDGILAMLERSNVRIAVVPANCTDRLQPLDVSVNKSVKEQLRRQFQLWYSDKISKQITDDCCLTDAVTVDLSMSVVKPLSLKWLVSVNEHLINNPEIIVNGFKQAGLC